MTDETQEQAPEVGKGKPPKSAQFKPGQSGNPRGRPRGAKGTKTILKEVLSERISISEGGRHRKVTKREAIIRNHVANAMKCDPRALVTFYSLMRDLGLHDAGDEIARSASTEELEMLSRHIDREVERRATSVPAAAPDDAHTQCRDDDPEAAS